ncbi:MAG: MraY family glycosyltransferase [Desulfococcaceae bacterium]|nr:MraY family glycosyltransferase [Desulfococcaceae bacterium]
MMYPPDKKKLLLQGQPDIPKNRKAFPLSASCFIFEKSVFIPLLAAAAMLFPPIRDFFRDAGWRWLYMLLFSLLFSYGLTPFCIRLAKGTGVLDVPDQRKSHPDATPLLGGIAVFVPFVTAIIINGIFAAEVWGLLAASGLLFGLGIADDIREIPAGVKLLAQILAASLVIISGTVLRVLPEHYDVIARAGNVFLTLFWIIGITNAMNFSDGMDGMAAGLGGLISLFLGLAAMQFHQFFLAWMAAAMMGSCLGFLPHNFRIRGNARIFMGDAGSTVIGFILASLAVYGEWGQDNSFVALTSPLLIFWILIFDMIYITISRIASGKVRNWKQWIEYVGKDHLHHRISDVLGSKKKSVLFIMLLTFCTGTGALVLQDSNMYIAFLLLVQASLTVILISILEIRGRTLAKQGEAVRNRNAGAYGSAFPAKESENADKAIQQELLHETSE